MSTSRRFPTVAALAWALSTGTARAEPRHPTHVACVGDSITAGAGASSTNKGYPSQLQGLLGSGVQVKNFGNSGSTLLTAPYGDKPYTQQVEYTSATSFVTGAGASAVVSVVIILGANDSKPYNWEPGGKPKNDQQFLKDYRALVDHFTALSPKPVVYVGYPLATGNDPCCDIRGDVIANEQLPLIEQLAVEKRLPIIDLNAPTTGHPEYFGDGVHPTDAGYLVLANLVKAGLAREPQVIISSPKPGATLEAGMVALSADAGDSTVDWTSVEFFEGDTSLGKATAKPFTVSWAAPAGPHSITAKATDTTLATGVSPALAFTVAAGGGGGVAGGGGGGQGGAANGGMSPGGVTSGSSSGGSPNGMTGGGRATGGTPGAGTAGAPIGSGGPGAMNPSGAAGSASSATTTPAKADGSCGCRLPGTRGGSGLSLLGVAASAVLGVRRRRSRR
jgi:lysophospholipase L1-like esterase